MPLFEFDAGRLVPAQFGHRAAEPLSPKVLDAVCGHALDLVQRPLFPVNAQAADAARRLTALDPAGRPVGIVVAQRLDGAGFVEALAWAGDLALRSWDDMVAGYAGESFDRDWSAFREAQPAGQAPGARVHLLVAEVDDDIRSALVALAGAAVSVHELNLREMSNGRRFVEVRQISGGQAIPLTAVGGIRREPSLPVGPNRRPAELDEAVVDEPAVGEGAGGEIGAGEIGAGESVAGESVAGDLGGGEVAAGDPGGDPGGGEPAGGDVRPTPPAQPDEHLRLIGSALPNAVSIVWQDRGGLGPEARLTTRGWIELPGGRRVGSPAAALQTFGVAPLIDPWRGWRFGADGPSLADAREELVRARERAAMRQAATHETTQGLSRRGRRRLESSD